MFFAPDKSMADQQSFYVIRLFNWYAEFQRSVAPTLLHFDMIAKNFQFFLIKISFSSSVNGYRIVLCYIDYYYRLYFIEMPIITFFHLTTRNNDEYKAILVYSSRITRF